MAQQGGHLCLHVEGRAEPIAFQLWDGRFNVKHVAEALRVSPLLIQFDAGGPFMAPATRGDGLTYEQFATNHEQNALLVKATAGAEAGGSEAVVGAPSVAGRKQVEDMLRDLKERLECKYVEWERELRESRLLVSSKAQLTLQRSIFAILLDQPACGGEGGSSCEVQPALVEQVPPTAVELVEQHKQNIETPLFGFFFRERGLAATADHCLGKERKVGDKVRVLMVYEKSTLELTIMKREPGLGYALLQYEVPPDALPDAPGTAFLEVDSSMEALRRGAPLALCACFQDLNNIGDASAMQKPEFLVMPASSLCRITAKQHQLVYSCSCFSGVCGIALVLRQNKILGLHVMRLNELKLKECAAHRQSAGDCMDVPEASVDSALVVQGRIALLASSMV